MTIGVTFHLWMMIPNMINVEQYLSDPEDKEMLEDLIITAFNDAKTKADSIYEEEMKKATGGMHLPGLF